MGISDAALSRGDVMRRMSKLEDRQRRIETARRLEAAAIGSGGLRVHGGGRMLVEDPAIDRFILMRDGHIGFGRLSDGLEPNAFVAANNQDVQLAATFNVFVDAGNQLVLRSINGDVFVGGEFVVIGHTALPVEAFHVSVGDQVLVTSGGQQAYQAGAELFLSSQGHTQIDAGDGGSLLQFADGQIVLDSDQDEVFISHQVTSGSANAAFVGDLILEVSSALRHKVDVRDFHVNPRTVLDLKPRAFRDRREVALDPDTDRWHVGLVAEEVHAAGLGEFVDYDEHGDPRSVTYDRLPLALLEVLQYQQQIIDRQGERIAALEQQVGAPSAAVGRVESIREPEPTPLPHRRPLEVGRASRAEVTRRAAAAPRTPARTVAKRSGG